MIISVLQWNIWYREDINNIVEFLRSQKPDIICLQELTVNFGDQSVKDTPAFVAGQLGYEYYAKELPIELTDGENMTLANAIFTRFPITKKHFHWINEPKGAGGYDDEYRAYIEATVRVGEKELTIGTTHMSYTDRFESTDSKKRETDVLLGELGKHNGNFIFTGDLNATPGSYAVGAVSGLLANASPDFAQKTWTTKPFSYNGFEETGLNWRLDYIFATRDMKPVSSEILPTAYSDHLPVLVRFDV